MNDGTETPTTTEAAPVTDAGADQLAPAVEQNDAQKQAAAILAGRKSKGAKAKATSADGAAPATPKEEKPKSAPGKIGYRFLRDLNENDRLNNQQKILMDAMLKLRRTDGDLKDVVLRDEILAEVTMEALRSRQPAERVLGFYMNGWKKVFAATEKKPEIPALFEVIKVVLKD